MIPREEIMPFIGEAKNISPDAKDAPYFALAMRLKCPIWSNDKDLKKQNSVEIYSTDDLVRMLG